MEQLEQRVETHQHHQACRIAALECYFAFLIYSNIIALFL